MNRQLALQLQNKLKISIDRIVREEYEMILLSSLLQSDFGSKLVFRGGTTLRLAYGSPRFSDDLDFSQIKKITEEEFLAWAKEVANLNSNLEVVEARKKYFTLFALFRIKDPVLAKAFSIKIEISTRGNGWKRVKDYTLMNLRSNVTPITITAQVAAVEKIKREKQTIKPSRIRDIFDLWFIGQFLKKPVALDFKGFSKEAVKAELHRQLGQGHRNLIEAWLQKK